MGELLDRLFAGEVRLVTVSKDGAESLSPPEGAVALAGSFNPLHYGHERLLAAAARLTGRRPVYELSITNVDKPPLPRGEVLRRLERFLGRAVVVVTRAPTFVEKSGLMPGTVFAIGYDTASRLFVEAYYPKYDAAADEMKAGSAVALAMGTLRRNGCSFAVAGRLGGDGRFHGLRDLTVPAGFGGLLNEIPEAEFRADVSSTELRAAAARRTREG
jgi:hypothetical protein